MQVPVQNFPSGRRETRTTVQWVPKTSHSHAEDAG